MAVVINGNGTVTGISVGGLPDGIVDSGTLATNSVDSAELIDGSIDTAHIAADQITSAILPAGSVLQIVNHLEGAAFSTTSTSLVDTNLAANITPSSTSSKVYVLVNAQLSGTDTGTVYGQMTVTRTPSGAGTTTISDNPRIDLYSQYNHHVYSVAILDSPGDAGLITYQVKVRTNDASQTIDCPHYLNDCSITLMEIAG